jgi:hypothetical protein
MIHITREGFKRVEWNGDIREYEEVAWGNPVTALRDGVEIDGDVSLRDVILLTAKDDFLRSFISAYSICSVADMAAAVADASLVTPLSEVTDCKYCCVALQVEVNHYDILKYTSLPPHDLTKGLDFHGVGDDPEQGWSLSLSPLKEIAALPVRLENRSIVTVYDGNLPEGQNPLVRRDDHLEYMPSLLEFLDAIFYDLSFHGGEADKAGVSADLMRQVKSIEDGTAELTPFEFEEKEPIN